jgi:hypothetical protein
MLGTIGKDFKYKIIDNFLSQEELELFKNYCFFKHRSNQSNFDLTTDSMETNADTYFGSDPLMEYLLLQKQKLVEKESGLKLFPTYSFWRMYTKFASLKKHKDRESCEISITVQIDSDGTKWPIYMDGKEHVLKNGQAIIYLGIEIEHWREQFKGDYQAQCFLHYVNADGVYKNFKYDKRFDLGI